MKNVTLQQKSNYPYFRKMLLSFIIPTHKDARVYETINSILYCKGWSDNDCEIIVALNGCPQAFLTSILKRYKNSIHVIFNEKPNIARARNQSILRASGNYIVHIDSDCILTNNYIDVLRSIIASQKISLLRGNTIFQDNGSQFSKLNTQLRTITYNYNHSICFTPNLVVAKYFYHLVGFYDENVYYGEDTEWSSRVNITKHPIIYNQNLVIFHRDDTHFYKTLITWWRYGIGIAYRIHKTEKLHRESNTYYQPIPGLRLPLKKYNTKLQLFMILFLLINKFGYYFGTLTTLSNFVESRKK